jgi:hypothetical protein
MSASDHPNITTVRRRKRLVFFFGERPTRVLRLGVMCVADLLDLIAKRLNQWLADSRYGTESR